MFLLTKNKLVKFDRSKDLRDTSQSVFLLRLGLRKSYGYALFSWRGWISETKSVIGKTRNEGKRRITEETRKVGRVASSGFETERKWTIAAQWQVVRAASKRAAISSNWAFRDEATRAAAAVSSFCCVFGVFCSRLYATSTMTRRCSITCRWNVHTRGNRVLPVTLPVYLSGEYWGFDAAIFRNDRRLTWRQLFDKKVLIDVQKGSEYLVTIYRRSTFHI